MAGIGPISQDWNYNSSQKITSLRDLLRDWNYNSSQKITSLKYLKNTSLKDWNYNKMARIGPISQDWEPLYIRKKAPNAAAKKDEKVVNAFWEMARTETINLFYETAAIGPISQDWEMVVARKNAPYAADNAFGEMAGMGPILQFLERVVNRQEATQRRAGAKTEIIKKYTAGTNKAASSITSLNIRKLDEETENLSHDRVPTELKKNITQARMDKKFTQAQLAQMINEKPRVIQEYESGKAIPNQQIITKLERVLGVKLRGKK